MDILKLKRLSSCHFNTPVNQSRWKPYALLGSIHLVARETSFPFKMAGKGLQKPAFNPLFSGTIQVPRQLPQPHSFLPYCCLAELPQLNTGAGEGDCASPTGSRGNQTQPDSSGHPASNFQLTLKPVSMVYSLGKTEDHLPGSHQAALLRDAAGAWYRWCLARHRRAQL